MLERLSDSATGQSQLTDYSIYAFSTRAPSRPNTIGISAVKIISVKDNEIEVDELDILDGTPLLDIKPYVSEFDLYPNEKSGWFGAKEVERKSADDRFKSNLT